MRDYFALRKLPGIDSDRQTMQVASFDRKEENGDFDQYLYKDADGSMVLFDEKGRGCIKSIWAAVTTDESILKFYFDGDNTPRYTCPLTSFFNGGIKEISGSANTFEDRGHGGDNNCCGNCFVPIPYENGLKITVSGVTNFYYHIMYERYTSDGPVELTTGDTGEYLKKAFDGVKEALKAHTYEKEVTLTEKYNNVFSAEGSGVITQFTVEFDEDTDLSKVQMDMFFDKSNISAVACPLLHYFAQPMGYTEVHSHAVDVVKENGRIIMTSRLPIPYWKSIGITFINFPRDAAKLTLKMTIEENTYDEDTTGHLYVDYREGLTELYEDWLIGEFHGRGNIVGVIQTCIGDQWCEGNEHFYINGAVTPQINGTGTEDFYLGCYWPNKKYDSPVAGCINDVFLLGGSTLPGAFAHRAGYYRFLCDMPISFSDGIKLAIQHGAVGQTYSDYTSLCFSYRRPDAAMIHTDYIHMGSASSKALHSYVSNDAEEYELSAKIEADRKAPHITRKGLLHKETASLSFKTAILPENRGIVIRRLYDQTHSPQTGEVYIDGEFAGTWHNPGYNDFAPFADSDFYVPASLTKGKDLVTVEIRVPNVFTDFEYKIITIIK